MRSINSNWESTETRGQNAQLVVYLQPLSSHVDPPIIRPCSARPPFFIQAAKPSGYIRSGPTFSILSWLFRTNRNSHHRQRSQSTHPFTRVKHAERISTNCC